MKQIVLILCIVLSSGHSFAKSNQDQQWQQVATALGNIENRLSRLENRLDKLEQSSVNHQNQQSATNADQSVLLEDFRTELKALKGDIGLIQHETQQQKQQSDAALKDFDLRLSDIEGSSSSATSSASAPVASSKQSAKSLYQSGLDDINGQNVESGIAKLQEFLQSFPKHKLASNAQYWIGEGFYANGKFNTAIKEFEKVLQKYSKSKKACAARLKQGKSFIALGKQEQALLFFQEAKDLCPNSTISQKASEALAELAN